MNAWQKKRAVVLNRDGSSCIYCKRKLSLDVPNNDPFQVTLEHIIPQSEGGNHLITNLTIACGPCNSYRGSLDFFHFLRQFTIDNEIHYKYQYLLMLGENLTCILNTISKVSKDLNLKEASALEVITTTANDMEIEERIDFAKVINECGDVRINNPNIVLPIKDLCYLLWKVNINVRTLAENVS